LDDVVSRRAEPAADVDDDTLSRSTYFRGEWLVVCVALPGLSHCQTPTEVIVLCVRRSALPLRLEQCRRSGRAACVDSRLFSASALWAVPAHREPRASHRVWQCL
jgi:hypothetical protein